MNWLFYVQFAAAILIGGWVARLLRGTIRSIIVRMMPIDRRIAEDSFRIQARIGAVVSIVLVLVVAVLVYQGVEYVKQRVGEATATVEKTLVADIPGPIPAQTSVLPLPMPAESSMGHTSPAPAAPVFTEAQFHLQLGAFDNVDNAHRLVARSRERLSAPVFMLHLPATPAPYKVLVGPFPSKVFAREFLKQHDIKGYVRIL